MQRSSRIEVKDTLTVILHWALVAALVLSLLTGLRIAADAEDAVWARALDDLLLQGDVITWHVWSAFGLAFVAVSYLAFVVRARLGARLALDAVRLRDLGDRDRRKRWNAINVAIFWLAYALILLAVVSGLTLYVAPGLFGYETVATVHGAVPWLIMAYVLLHVIAQFIVGGFGRLLKIFNPRAAYGTAAVFAVAVAAPAVGTLYGLDRLTIRESKVARTLTAPVLDGDPSDAVWNSAAPFLIHTVRGKNLPGGEVTVRLRALHDGERIYALFEWPDSTRSQKFLPLKKTVAGWEVMQRKYGIHDEDQYYEDKLAVMLARSPTLAGAGTTHLGRQPLPGRPGSAGGRGLHYTTDGSIVDVWHWKSVRTGSPAMNQADDNYFGPPIEPDPKKNRYAGGYTQDPKLGGGFSMNWERFSDGLVRPRRLPSDPAALEWLGRIDPDPDASDTGQIWLAFDDTVPYSEAVDTYPIGTIMPSVLIEGPFVGDRGDVRAVGRWSAGWWHVEMSRRLDTGSQYDVPLRADEPVYLWVSVFDHTQTRHSQHLQPVRIILE